MVNVLVVVQVGYEALGVYVIVYVPAVEVDGVITPVEASIVNPDVLVKVPPAGLNVGVTALPAEHTSEFGYDKLGLQV